MNKTLLIWNIVITIALAAAVFSGCTSLDPQLASAVQEVKANRAVLEQVVNTVNQNRADIDSLRTEVMKNTLAIANQQTVTQAAITALDNSLQQYVQQFVQAYVSKAIQ
jgi:outer membrane murein-binding lipoprotein Lpp